MKVVVLTFGGRECSLRILFPLLLKYKSYIDEYRLYIATTIQSDINYMESFANENDFVKTVYCNINGKCILDDRELIWDNAYKTCQEDNTIYIKLDDDIVYLDETLFTDFVQYRIENRNAPILYPMIINNTVTSSILEKHGLYRPYIKSDLIHTWKNTYERIRPYVLSEKNSKILRIGDFVADREILCPYAWGNLKYCCDLHEQFLQDLKEGNVHKYLLSENIVLENAEPISINACSWVGEDLREYVKEYGDHRGTCCRCPSWHECRTRAACIDPFTVGMK